MTLRLARDGQSFAGRRPDGGWWIGERAAPGNATVPGGVGSPRDALRRFLFAATFARDHAPLAWIAAVEALYFGEADRNLSWGNRLEKAQQLFQLLDLVTVRLDDVVQHATGDEVLLSLPQAGSPAYMPLRLRRDQAGGWRLVIPTSAEFAALRESLTAARGGRFPGTEAFRNRMSPRDGMRAFLDAMARWERGGREAALAALDLSNLPEVSRMADGETLAQTLRRALDRIGLDALQSIPDDSASREPFVLFAHPAGRIVLAPVENERGKSWVFAAETVGAAVFILRAAEQLPPPTFRPPGAIPHSNFFVLRQLVDVYAPALLAPLRRFEVWQLMGILVSLVAAGGIGMVASGLICALLQRLAPEEGIQPTWFRNSLTVCIAIAIASFVPATFGIPAQTRRYALPIVGSVIILSVHPGTS